jgi:hypothetical protein
MGVSGQSHDPTALYPRGKDVGTHWIGGWAGLRSGLDTEAWGKIPCLCRGTNPGRPVVQSVVRHDTDWDSQTRVFCRNLNSTQNCNSASHFIRVWYLIAHCTVGTWLFLSKVLRWKFVRKRDEGKEDGKSYVLLRFTHNLYASRYTITVIKWRRTRWAGQAESTIQHIQKCI